MMTGSIYILSKRQVRWRSSAVICPPLILLISSNARSTLVIYLMTGPSTNNKDSFFARKEQAEFVMRVYRETPAVIRDLFRQENELLLKALGESRRVLEIGRGFGRAVDSVPSGSSYFGIDIGLPYIVEASHLHPNRLWICGDATRLPLPDRCFDTAFCIQNTLGNMIGL